MARTHLIRRRLPDIWKKAISASLATAVLWSGFAAAEEASRPMTRSPQVRSGLSITAVEASADPSKAAKTPAQATVRLKPMPTPAASEAPVVAAENARLRPSALRAQEKQKVQRTSAIEDAPGSDWMQDIETAVGPAPAQPATPVAPANEPQPTPADPPAAEVIEVGPRPAGPQPLRAAVAPLKTRTRVSIDDETIPRLAQAAQAPAENQEPIDLTNPFEVIPEIGEVSVMVRRSKLMRTRVDIYRTATVDPGVVEIVQFTPRELSLIGKSVGSTHVTFWFDQPGSRPVTYLVRVEPDVEQVKVIEDQYRLLEDVINEMFPDSKIELVVLADKLIVKGQAKDGEDAAQILALVRGQGGGGQGPGGMGGGGLNGGTAANVLDDSVTGSAQRSRLQVINMLRVPGIQQVSLRVKIAELNRTAARGFGVSVAGAANLDGFANGSKLFFNSLVNAANGQGPALLARVDGDDISIGIKYLQQHGVLRLLSEPTLVTMSGRPATFVAGGEIAVPTVVGAGGVNAVTTDFRAFGAIISFVPTVMDKDKIRLSVSPEFSQIDAGNAVGGTPGFKVRSATTTVEMREGQTLAIAGLLEDNMTSNKRGDLPFVSWLFGDRSVSHNETELIILVTPDLVQPMDPEEVPPLPGFDVTEPDNAQFFFQGRLEGNPTYDYRSTVWPRLRKRYGGGGSAMTSGPFGHGQ